MTDFQKKFGARIKELRKRREMTQEQLSEKIDIGVRSLGKIETGKSFPSVETLEKLVLALNTTNPELFNFEHLQNNQDLKKEIDKLLEQNPDKIQIIYKIIKAVTN
jgi:transcriptional regulator with XRE-family HTH domain